LANKVLITGGTGFIGRALCKQLSLKGAEVTVLSRHPEKVPELCGSSATGINSLEELDSAAKFDTVINLAGEPIADRRWSGSQKERLGKSRIDLTKDLLVCLKRMEQKPECLISGSAVGYYGDQGDMEVDEATAAHDEFTHQLCRDWEAEALRAEELGIRVCIIRTGLVVGKDGGFLSKMLPPFRAGLGGPIGNGSQWMPWIHMDDIVALILFLIERKDIRRIFNGTAPQPVTNREFTKTLADLLKRPALLPAPALALKLALGEMSRLLLTGQRALPKAALGAGFVFRFEELRPALEDVLSKN